MQTNNSFKEYLNKTKTRLDVSIQSADKWFQTGNTKNKIQDFLESNVTIEHKTDGIKLTAIKTKDDWILAYKGNILYKNEFSYNTITEIKNHSIGCSQFRIPLEHFQKYKNANIPENTELFIEYLMKKPTLSSNYTELHEMVLIGYSESVYCNEFGKLTTESSGINLEKRDEYAKELNLDVPEVLFKGKIKEKTFISSIINDDFKKIYNNSNLSWDNPEILINELKELFLKVPSKYGGLEEGVVVSYNRLLKWQQEYQLCQESRNIIKMKYKECDLLLESNYWKNVQKSAKELFVHFFEKNNNQNISELMNELSEKLNSLNIEYKHSKKCISVIKDDIQLNAKNLILKNLKGNNNSLVLGKFRVLTENGHIKLIREAQKNFDNVVICLVTSKDSKHTKELREQMLLKTFPNIEIIHAYDGNINRILQKSKKNINAIYAGSDRVQSYQNQVKNMMGVKVLEIPRTDDDISATKILENIQNKSYFLEHTPKEIHKLYESILETY